MPQSVVVLIHASHLGASADMVSEWAGQPLPLDQPLGEMIGERLSKLVDVDGSADMTLAVQDRGAHRDPEVRVAVGLPIKDFEATRSQLQGEPGLVGIGNGAFEIVRAGSHRREGDSDFRSCAIAPAKTGGRLVCSRDASSRDLVLAYLTRGLAHLATSKSDVHVDARPGPLREIVQRERANIMQSGARWMGGSDKRALTEAAIADLCDSFLDTDRATVDATLDAKVGAIDFKITAKGSQGLTTRILSGHPDRAEPPPAMFLRLPDDADVAFFEHGIDAAQLAGPRTQTIAFFESLAAQSTKISAADQKAFMDAYSHTLDFAAVPIVYARGVDFSKAIPAVAGLTEQSDAAKIRAGAEQAAGYDIIGIDAAPDKVIALAKELVAAVSRPVIATDMKDTKWRVVAAPRNAPAGSVHLALTHELEDADYSQPRTAKKRPPIVLTMHSLIVPDGTHAWIVSALDETTAVNKARSLVAASPTNGTLATRAGLDGLRASRINAGGFITPRGVGLGVPFSWLDTWNLRYKMGNDPLVGVSSQSQFTTPIVFSATEAAENDEKSLTISLRITRAVVAEALAVAPHIFR